MLVPSNFTAEQNTTSDHNTTQINSIYNVRSWWYTENKKNDTNKILLFYLLSNSVTSSLFLWISWSLRRFWFITCSILYKGSRTIAINFDCSSETSSYHLHFLYLSCSSLFCCSITDNDSETLFAYSSFCLSFSFTTLSSLLGWVFFILKYRDREKSIWNPA